MMFIPLKEALLVHNARMSAAFAITNNACSRGNVQFYLIVNTGNFNTLPGPNQISGQHSFSKHGAV